MFMTEIIARKRDGHPLAEGDIRAFIAAYTRGDVPDYQAAALLMAIFLRGLNGHELSVWTEAMLRSGEVLDLQDVHGVKVDKHSTGGVGDKISLPLAPLLAEVGVVVPMISGRGLGHTGGTLDKLEAIPGFRTDQPVSRFRELLRTFGFGLIGQTAQIAPADKLLYALRDATATVECIPLIASSILSKKLAEGIDGLVLDVKTGSGAFLPDLDQARLLARTMVDIGQRAGVRTVALLTDMDQPLGAAVGNALEVQESLDVLRGEGPADVRELTLVLGVEMLRMARPAETDEVLRGVLEDALDSGRALERFIALAEAQGGDAAALRDPSRLPRAPRRYTLRAAQDGVVQGFRTREVGHAATLLGAGRAKKEDTVDPAVGVVLHRKRGEPVRTGEALATLHYAHEATLGPALERLTQAFVIGEEAPAPRPLVLERLA